MIPADGLVVEITRPGPPEVLVPARRPVTAPRAGEVLLRVAAAGVNRPDVMQRRGQYPPPPGRLGHPRARGGGRDRRGWSGRRRSGASAIACARSWREAATPSTASLRRRSACPFPARFDAVEAAALPETFFTVWTNVFERGRLAAGETILVHGGTSGIGTAAIALARAFGARVLATAGSAEKCAACLRLGAEVAINYREEDFVAVVKEKTGGRGVDVVLDIVAGDYVPRNLECLAVEGRLVIIAVQGGANATVNLLPILQRRLTVTGSTLRPRTVAEKGAIARALREKVWPLLESGAGGPGRPRHASRSPKPPPPTGSWSRARTSGKIVLTV